MLQPDEIIIQKEWYQLTDIEKESLKELADSETAFNLLKKMLMVSAEEVTDVPNINPDVYKQVIRTLPARKMNIKKYWIAAAAVTIIALSTAIFILKDDKRTDFVNTNIEPVINDSSIKKEEHIVHNQKDSGIKKNHTDSSSKQNLVKTIHKQQTSNRQSTYYNLPDSSLANTYAIQTSVASDPSLLEFIEEAE